MPTQTELFRDDEDDPPQVILALDEGLWGLQMTLACLASDTPHGADPVEFHRKAGQARRLLDEIARRLVVASGGEPDSCFGCGRGGRLRGGPRSSSTPVLDIIIVEEHGPLPLCRNCALAHRAPA